jgi:hypothetical protein
MGRTRDRGVGRARSWCRTCSASNIHTPPFAKNSMSKAFYKQIDKYLIASFSSIFFVYRVFYFSKTLP